jgi:hypothetical protein
MMRTAIKFVVLLAMTGSASAQAPTQEPSAYCRAGVQALFTASGGNEYEAVRKACRRGDTIAINAGSQGAVFQVGRLCDFTKAIVNVGPQIVCVLVGERSVR